MKQVLQNLKTGKLEVVEIPAPVVKPGHVLIQTRCSLISAGTERMLVSFAKSSLIGKAKQQPEKVKQVIDKARTDGLLPTIHSVFSRLDEPMPLGYCNCGTVLEVGEGVDEFKPGDRVVNNGPHAEIVCVAKNLCAKVPDNVSDEQAAFTILGAIGLQGVRLLEPAFGETVVVFGLGLIGLISVQLLKNSGCKVIGIDLDENKLKMAQNFGAEVVDLPAGADPVETVQALTGGNGVDAVLITAAAKNDSIVHQSAQMCRKRGRIVLVGVVNLNLDRSDFYDKELSFQVSCSYGPGRYDKSYEEKGRDYPFGFVRWTEQRNFQAILQSLSDGSLEVGSLVSEHFPQKNAPDAYRLLTEDSSKMALILTYPLDEKSQSDKIIKQSQFLISQSQAKVVAGLIGAGNFAKIALLPAIKSLDIRLKTVADINGVSADHAAKKFGFEQSSNDYKDILQDPEINTVFITTRHDLHATMVIEALQAGKNVHVEKPLCLNKEQLQQIKQTYQQAGKQLLVGFNRRFSPHGRKIRSLLQTRNAPCCLSWLINAGMIPKDVWVHDEKVGGGRIIGEGCHWLDFMRYIIDKPITCIQAAMIGDSPAVSVRDDKITIVATFEDGSIGTLHYFANGHKSFPKENFIVFCENKILELNNFRKLKGFGWSNFNKMNLFGQNKGLKEEFQNFIECINKGSEPIIPFEEIENVTLATFAAVQSALSGDVIKI
ncbi:MAG: bi-domain-containing oxidoreductase [Planctomycetota bacterium]|jgi:predicted dehydrogenase/NADPH:quinone reductase-like Zn-dependent oxidoreductase